MLGLAAGCFLSALLALTALTATPLAWYWLPLVTLAAVAAGGLLGFCRPVSRLTAARRIDAYYRLKDRAVTALQFESDADPVRQMQVADARFHLRQVHSEDCVPFASHGGAMGFAGACALLALGLMFFPETPQHAVAEARPVALATSQASLLREQMIPEIESLRELEEWDEVEELSDRLADLIERMETEAFDEHDLMAKLSQMELAIAEARESLAIEATDADLKRLGEAFLSSSALSRAAAAMVAGDHGTAGELLENVDPRDMSDKERRAVAEDLKKFAKRDSANRRGQISDVAREIAEGLEKQNDSQCRDGLCKLAGLCKSQANRKKIGECMACQLNRLAECKGQCRGACSGDKPGNSNSLSSKPSSNWGTGTTGDPGGGPKTELDSNRREEQLFGTHGDGPSESEVLESPEGEQAASRDYIKRYQEFRSQAEAVLDSEPLPPGHRETVRRYFENIRPTEARQLE